MVRQADLGTQLRRLKRSKVFNVGNGGIDVKPGTPANIARKVARFEVPFFPALQEGARLLFRNRFREIDDLGIPFTRWTLDEVLFARLALHPKRGAYPPIEGVWIPLANFL